MDTVLLICEDGGELSFSAKFSAEKLSKFFQILGSERKRRNTSSAPGHEAAYRDGSLAACVVAVCFLPKPKKWKTCWELFKAIVKYLTSNYRRFERIDKR